MPFEFSVSDLIPASAQAIYDAWLSSSGHENITGGQKAQISAQEGAAFTVWNGYITGRNLKLEPGPAHRPIVAHHQIHRHRSGFADRSAAAAGGGRHHGYGAAQQCARRPHQLPRRRMAAQLFRADEATLQARAMRSCRVRGARSEGDWNRHFQIGSLVLLTTRRRPILSSERQLQVRTPPANRTAQMRTATSMEPTIPSHSL